MSKLLSILSGKKTYSIAVITLIFAWVGVYLKQVTINQAIELTLGALGLGSLRNAIK